MLILDVSSKDKKILLGLKLIKEDPWKNINDYFKVTDKIPRCSATNLQPGTNNVTLNLPLTLRKFYNHNYIYSSHILSVIHNKLSLGIIINIRKDKYGDKETHMD